MTVINVKKILESNLPAEDTDFTMSFTDEGNLYITREDGSQMKVTDIMTGYTNAKDLQMKNPALKNKLYFTNEGSLYIYDGVMYIEISSGGSGSGTIDGVKQITKLNVVAPHTTTIDIAFTSKFGGLPLEVLKVDSGSLGVTETLCDFNNADADDFEKNKYVEFDGVMKLKTRYTFDTDFISNGIYEFDFSKLDQFRRTNSITTRIKTDGQAILDSGGTTHNSNLSTKATIAKTSGKWYWEVTKLGGSDYQFYGICGDGLVETMHDVNVSGYYTTMEAGNARYIHKGNEDNAISVSGGLEINDVLGIALDLDNDTIQYYKNGVLMTVQPTTFKPSDLGTNIYPVITSWQLTNIKHAEANFGSRIFKYDVPKGYLPYNFIKTSEY